MGVIGYAWLFVVFGFALGAPATFENALEKSAEDEPILRLNHTAKATTDSKESDYGSERTERNRRRARFQGQISTTQEQETTNLEQETTTVERETTPVEQETTSVEQETTTLEQETTTLEQETTTVERETTTVEQETTSVEQETTTLEQETTTVEQGTTTLEQETTTLEQETTTLEQEPTTEEQETTTVEQETTTVEQETTTVEQETTTVKQETTTVKQETTTVEQETTETTQQPMETTQEPTTETTPEATTISSISETKDKLVSIAREVSSLMFDSTNFEMQLSRVETKLFTLARQEPFMTSELFELARKLSKMVAQPSLSIPEISEIVAKLAQLNQETVSTTTEPSPTTESNEIALENFALENRYILEGLFPSRLSEEFFDSFNKFLRHFYESMDTVSLDEMSEILSNKQSHSYGFDEEEEKALISEIMHKLWELEDLTGNEDSEQVGTFFRYYGEVLKGLSVVELQRVRHLYEEVLTKAYAAMTTESTETTAYVSDELHRFTELNKAILRRLSFTDPSALEAYFYYLHFFYQKMDSNSLFELTNLLENKMSDQFGVNYVMEQKFLEYFLNQHRKFVARTQCEGLEQLEKFLGFYGRVLEGLSVNEIKKANRIFYSLLKNAGRLSSEEC